jgi:hypothetical protein
MDDPEKFEEMNGAGTSVSRRRKSTELKREQSKQYKHGRNDKHPAFKKINPLFMLNAGWLSCDNLERSSLSSDEMCASYSVTCIGECREGARERGSQTFTAPSPSRNYVRYMP